MNEPARKPDKAALINHARMDVVEKALIGFVEGLLGRVPSDEEILSNGHHIQFSVTPLTVYEKSGKRFAQYYSYGHEVLALGFLDSNHPLELYVCRVPRAEWPPALTAYMVQNRGATEFPQPNNPTDK